MLISLFTTARRFNMEVQPSLVLLQKTLLNIEGPRPTALSRNLDLWTTAQPFLDKWLKDRYSPKSMFKQFKTPCPGLAGTSTPDTAAYFSGSAVHASMTSGQAPSIAAFATAAKSTHFTRKGFPCRLAVPQCGLWYSA